ncbi:chemotaxis protein CheW [Alsobacter sp. SYSU M60028]|uniref:Chemotaxis protein CheW n=1 Tax=Alsobacter ponti TaxID=2962936 RepID=A0ABT1LES4_9HYPH|nr:chemotaxis protein CheW [Alsobacter ponti]
MTETDTANAQAPRQIVTFKIGEQTFGVPVDGVREIKGWQPTTSIPNAEPHVLGVINLRGQVIAVYDLRIRLERAASERDKASVVIVVDSDGRNIGILADAVSDILDVTSGELRPPPLAANENSLIDALVVKGDEVIPLIDIARVA